jgi:hypothetical protein
MQLAKVKLFGIRRSALFPNNQDCSGNRGIQTRILVALA